MEGISVPAEPARLVGISRETMERLIDESGMDLDHEEEVDKK
jgi:hypothetical protein